MGLKKVCTDCGAIIDYSAGYICDTCNTKRNKDKYNYEKANHKRLYHTKRWQRLRRNIMAKYNWLCLPSLEQGLIVEAKILHHIEEANESNFYDKDNLIPLSFNMHEEVHRRYDNGKESKRECQEWLRKLKDTPLQDKI